MARGLRCLSAVATGFAPEDPCEERRNMTTTTTTIWTVCNSCHGKGVIRRRRHATASCKFCSGSGLLPSSSSSSLSAETTTTTTASPSSMTNQEEEGIAAPTLRIAIVGGGLAGLALAAALSHRRFHHVTVYERDATFFDRAQGYGLTLQQAAAQLAALGISQPLSGGITSTKHIVHDAQGQVKGTWGFRHWMGGATAVEAEEEDATATCDSTTTSPPPPEKKSKPSLKRKRARQNIHIARQALRWELYLAATAQNKTLVQWNHRLIHYQKEPTDGTIALTWAVPNADGTATTTVQTTADLLVGADGIRSQVRQQFLPQDEPLRYLGCIVILGICPIGALVPDMTGSPFGHLLDGATVFQTADGSTRIYMMPYSSSNGGEYMWQLSFCLPEDDAKELSRRGAAALQQEALRRCHEWHSPIPEILTATPRHLISGYPVYDREVGPALRRDATTDDPTTASSRRVTLLGDAAHCMSPFKGQGANQALLDALSLARCLYRTARTGRPDWEGAVAEYEAEMWARSVRKVQASAAAAVLLHSDVALYEGNVTRGAANALLVRQNKNSGAAL